MIASRIALAAVLGACAQTASAQSDVWHLLEQIEIEEVLRTTEDGTTYEVRKTFPDALSGKSLDVEITGYAVPALPGDVVQDLILVSDMGLCPLCGSADHGASLQVALAEPIESFDESRRLTFKGKLKPVLDRETWQAAMLENASIIGQ